MTRFRLWSGLAALLTVLVLAACGPSAAQPADPAASATTTAVARQQALEAMVQATLTAMAPTPTPTPPPGATPVVAIIASPADVPRITPRELKARLDAGQAVVFDARRRELYAQRHVPGAISLPQSEVTARLAELPADKQAVFYCT